MFVVSIARTIKGLYVTLFQITDYTLLAFWRPLFHQLMLVVFKTFTFSRLKCFSDYLGLGIWVAWNEDELDVDILLVHAQFIHCKIFIRDCQKVVFDTVAYGDNEVVPCRDLWHELSLLASSIVDDPWFVLGNFNAVVDMSEVCGNLGDIRLAMEDFCACILDAGLISLPMQGCSFTWHNCSEGHRSLWKRLDCMLVNDLWLMNWPNAYCLSLTMRTSGHSPLVLGGYSDAPLAGLFRFDNFLARSPEFILAVQNVWRHHIVGTLMYAVTRKLKALKTVFRAQRKKKGDLALNVKLATEFLLRLESCCRLIFLKAAKLEQCMLKQRAKMQWLQGGDQCTRAFFRKIAKRRAAKWIFQINTAAGDTCTDQQDIINEFVGFFLFFLGKGKFHIYKKGTKRTTRHSQNNRAKI
ncbi:UNVERIFIED_CONTAM: hypothetical protein Slati_0876200 [Sesamum latifolium]|uniref:Reverse transcriptase n=1 Tax=Sesamum latifolium TaxID=2727402 RepID=A0AAW2XUB7_9LAMI